MAGNGRIALWLLLVATATRAEVANAGLSASDSVKSGADVHLLSSKVRVAVGAQWIDVEEDAELQVSSGTSTAARVFQVGGTFELPARAKITGCLFWRGDSIVKGKLRVHAKAVQQYSQIVNDTSDFSKDPLLIEHVSEDTYRLRAYPFAPGEFRKIRIRYIAPVVAENGEVSVLPVFSKVSGNRPSSWTLAVRGAATGLKLKRDASVWALSSPSIQSFEFPVSGSARLVWNGSASLGAERAVVDRIQSGPWAGDFVMYTGKIPDSLARRVEIRSETVVLWRWIHPEGFSAPCGDDTCLGVDGQLAASQAGLIHDLADWIAAEGNKVGLVADLSRDEQPILKPMGDSASAEFRNLSNWIGAAREPYVKWRTSSLAGVPGMDLENNRARFARDLALAGAMFSKDTSVVKHVLVVTVGPDPTGADYAQTAIDSGLPAGISVASTLFTGKDSSFDAGLMAYVSNGYARASWPGVDLRGLEADRIGRRIGWINGVRIPRSRNYAAATISIPSANGTISAHPIITKSRNGSWFASLNVHDQSLGRSLRWLVSDENGDSIVGWTSSPTWTEFVDDSAVPRLWASSPLRETTLRGFQSDSVFGAKFGYVDSRFSLLALPSDMVSPEEALALRDSGVPFLRAPEIFLDSTAYKNKETNVGVRPRTRAPELRLNAFAVGRARIRIEFSGEKPRRIQILDVQGRVVREWTADELVGRTHLEWDVGGGAWSRGGVLLVRLVGLSGARSVPVVLP